MLFGSSFMGESFLSYNPYIAFYYHLFVNFVGQGFVALFVVIYIVIDYLFSKVTIMKKYFSAVILSIGIVLFLFRPYWYNPWQLYTNEGYQSFKNLNFVWNNLSSDLNRTPTTIEFVQAIKGNNLLSENDRRNLEQNLDEWSALLRSNNATMIFWAPLNKIMIYVNLMVLGIVGFLLLIMFYYDKPYYPYIDKFMSGFIILFAVEAFHAYAATNALFMESYREIVTIGQYFTVGILIVFIYLFHLNLRFIISPIAIYYQEALQSSPYRVTRWRDEIDTFVLKYFSGKIGWGKRIAQTDNIK
jgi:hypothetical protein